MIFHNGKILIDGKLVSRDIEVKDGLIAAIEPKLEGEGIDLKGNYVCPGLTDIHVHFREPGNSHKESILTGSKAAAKGGYTTVCLMPNLKPCPDSLEHLKVEEDIIAKDAVVECLPYASVTVGEKGEELSDIDELSTHTALFSDDGVGIQDLSLLGNALDKVASKGLFIASHAEDDTYKTKPEGEYIAVRREIEEAKKHKAPYHFCHMSTKESFEAIKAAQKEGYKISCEVAPHHLFLNEEMVKGNPNWKMNPPLKSEDNRQATVKALLEGVASVIATDHAPHSKEEKENVPFEKAPNGIIGLETAAPIVYTNLVKTGLATLKDFEDWLSNNPRKLIGLEPNEIKVGKKANFCVLDLDYPHAYVEEEILSKGHNCPYIGMTLYGFNSLTVYKGTVVYQKEER